jgi:hypothetical protein
MDDDREASDRRGERGAFGLRCFRSRGGTTYITICWRSGVVRYAWGLVGCPSASLRDEVQLAAVTVGPDQSAQTALSGTGGTIEIAFVSGASLDHRCGRSHVVDSSGGRAVG